MPLLIFCAFFAYIFIGFIIGLFLSFPMASPAVLGTILIVGFIHDLRNGSIWWFLILFQNLSCTALKLYL